jgi:hypothetical protein
MTQSRPIIGKGEITTLFNLKKLFKNEKILIQFPFKDLMVIEEFAGSLSERQEKETLDIVVFTPKITVIRVQGHDHKGVIKSARDTVQKKMLEWNGCRVVDVWHYDSPVTWKGIVNEDSLNELKDAFTSQKVELP